MSVLRFAIPPLAKARPPADDLKPIFSALIDDLQILALESPRHFTRVAEMVHTFARPIRKCVRAELRESRRTVNKD